MKIFLTAAALGAGILLTGCGTTVVEGRPGYGNNGYYNDSRNGYGDHGTQYRTRDVRRTNVYQNNVYETNVHRNDVNRTVVKTSSQGGKPTANMQSASAARTQTHSKDLQPSSKKNKVKNTPQPGNGNENKPGDEAQTRQ